MTVAHNENIQDLSEFDFETLAAMQGEDVFEAAGYAVVEKDELVKKPFIVTGVTFRESDQNNTGYVSLEATTADNEKVVINDGSTGILAQIVHLAVTRGVFLPDADTALKDDVSLAELVNTDNPKVYVSFSQTGEWNIRWHIGLLKCKRGLRRSDYDAREVDGRKIPAGTTFYIA
jgi:hypothetical protein